MAVKYVQKAFTSQRNILAMPDGYVNVEVKLAKDHSLAVTEDGRKIVRAGTIYPANDSTALGIIFNDYDVTDGDEMAALLISGFVLTSALPVVPVNDALAALKAKGIHFLPEFTPTVTFSAVAALFKVGDLINAKASALVTIAGATFRKDLVTAKANWTIDGHTTNKAAVDTIEYVDAKTVKINFKLSATAVEGNTTVIPGAGVISVGITTATPIVAAKVEAV